MIHPNLLYLRYLLKLDNHLTRCLLFYPFFMDEDTKTWAVESLSRSLSVESEKAKVPT